MHSAFFQIEFGIGQKLHALSSMVVRDKKVTCACHNAAVTAQKLASWGVGFLSDCLLEVTHQTTVNAMMIRRMVVTLYYITGFSLCIQDVALNRDL